MILHRVARKPLACVSPWLFGIGLIALALPAQAQLTQAELEAASRAALSDKPVGVPDRAPPELAIPRPAPEPARQPSARAQRVAAERAAEQQRVDSETRALIGRLRESNEFYKTQVETYSAQLQTNQQAVQNAAARLERAKKDLETYNASRNPVERFFVQSNLETVKEAEIAAAERQLAQARTNFDASRTALTTSIASAEGNAHALQVQIAKVTPERLEAAEGQRLDALTPVYQQYETQQAQFNAGQAKFRQANADLTQQIQTAEQQGNSDLVDLLEGQQTQLLETHNMWKRGMETELGGYRRDLERVYEQNRQDGIGPTSTYDLEFDLRRRARSEGRDPDQVSYVDQAAVSSAAQSADAVAAGAGNNTQHVSIFTDPLSGSAYLEFGTDVVVGNAQDIAKATDIAGNARDFYTGITTGDFSALADRQAMVTRFGSYLKGVARGGKDAVVDLAVFAKEAGITLAEATQLATGYWTATKPTVLGTSRVDALHEGLAVADAIYFDEGIGTVAMADKLLTGINTAAGQLERGAEKLAGRGDNNRAMEYTGYGAITILDPTDKLLGGVFGFAKDFLKGDELAQAINRLDDLNPGMSRGWDEFLDLPPGSSVVPGGAATPGFAPTQLDNMAPDFGTPVSVRSNADGSQLTLVDANGNTTVLDNKLGAGSSSAAYKLPDGRVLKVTKGGEGALDDFGYDVIRNIDPDGKVIEVPSLHSRQTINSDTVYNFGDAADPKFEDLKGGGVRVVDEAPRSYRDSPELHGPDGGMTPAQLDAYHKGMEALNSKGYVWLDNKADNYTFAENPDGSLRLVVVDPGGIVPMKGMDADAARRMQNAIDDPQRLADEMGLPSKFTPESWGGNNMHSRGVHHGNLAELFDDLVDWDELNRILNQGVTDPDKLKNYQTLNLLGGSATDAERATAFPFNPMNGIEVPGVARPTTPIDVPELKRPVTGGDGPIVLSPERGINRARLDELQEYADALDGLKEIYGPGGYMPWNMLFWDYKFLRIMEMIREKLGDEAAEQWLRGALAAFNNGATPAGLESPSPLNFFGEGIDPATGLPPGPRRPVTGGSVGMAPGEDGSGDTEYAIGIGGPFPPSVPGMFITLAPPDSRPETGDGPFISLPPGEGGVTTKILIVLPQTGNNGWNTRDPLIPDSNNQSRFFTPGPTQPPSTGGGSGGGGPMISVVRLGSELIPVSRLVVSPPDACPGDHYHAFSGAFSCQNVLVFDPRPSECGFGEVGVEFNVPASQCPSAQ
ncbi:hypothetical protein NCG89_11705 [Spongiibacter taiwanensis]|uniref:hypothetical protein n=1 Tax=Spongiibacter taiwanensis TaxID=1748242 RepID=UPI00203501C3|nr:hypothetical protein [Spongiibacter taiwanensis]USA42186.1 hypothetical protein NCG89_11705 [Spongiibacter taiwanensis]